MRKALLASTTMAAALSVGCMLERPYDIREPGVDLNNDPIIDDSGNTYAAVRGAIDGHILGQVGPMLGLDHDASEMVAFDDGEYASIETVVVTQDRAAMTLLSIVGPRTVLRPGFSGSFALENYATSEVNVTMLGCVGQEVDVYDEYDMPADDVSIDVDEGAEPDEVQVNVSARWFEHDVESGARLATFREAHTNFTLLR